MKKVINEGGGYRFESDENKDLALFDSEGAEAFRTKIVNILAEGTLNNWVEVAENTVD